MQPWYTVLVTNEESEHKGRAGKILSVIDDEVVVELDETETHEGGQETFARDDLKVLGTA